MIASTRETTVRPGWFVFPDISDFRSVKEMPVATSVARTTMWSIPDQETAMSSTSPRTATAVAASACASGGMWPVLLCWLAVALDGFDLVVLGAAS
jgi:hypothetical protein